MQTTEGNEHSDDDIPVYPGDNLASDAEVQQAMSDLYRDASMKKKLVAVAAIILQRKEYLKHEYQPEDLFQEAIERIGMRRRAWPKNRVNFAGLVIGVMKSWASSLENSRATDDRVVVMEHEFASENQEGEGLKLEEVATDFKTPMEHLESQELHAKEECFLTLLKAQYAPHVLEARILDAIVKQSFVTHEEIIRELDVKTTDYRNAWKVLLRAAKKLGPKE